MLDALKGTLEIPDNIKRVVAEAKKDGDGYSVTIDQDEAMAMTEMCQWYIKKDPVTGKLGTRAEIFNGIVKAIYAAEDQ